MNNIFNIKTIETESNAQVKEMLSNVKTKNGFIPNLVGVLANSQPAITYYLENSKLNGTTILTPIEREVVQIVTAIANGCEFCKAGHSAIAKKIAKMDDATLEALKNEQIVLDTKLNVLAQTVRLLIAFKGDLKLVPDMLKEFLDFYPKEALLDILLGISLATFTNYVNNLNDTEINKELIAFK